MANIELIEAKTSTSSSVTFSAIPQTYTDLKLLCSTRLVSGNFPDLYISFNGSTSNFTNRNILGSGASATSGTEVRVIGFTEGTSQTSSTFTNGEVYIPNYTSSNYKSFSADNVTENNATTAYSHLVAGLWSDVSAITSITISSGANFDSASTFYLYGISNVTSGSKATGGIVSSDGTYWYHMFPYSGTFTPTTAISADVLCIAGGGGGGQRFGGGGGAGGLLYFASQSLTATGYTVTVGAGGAGSSNDSLRGTSGANSQFGSLTATVGGGGGGSCFAATGLTGGSGGGGADNGSGAGGSPTTSQGYVGGTGGGGFGGGGGGAGAAGTSGSSGGNGGNGVATYLSWANATQTGVGGYYAAGGGGGDEQGTSPASYGGLGGGGNGARAPESGYPAKINTGSGGGGGGQYTANPYTGTSGGAGGSGLVIIRYAI